ncbi:2-oxo acid dehydrogenase subunit E2 [Cupriavidus sp. H18C1]|uniref:2-oxo acid dehydrogenase subunit E2 n=1 Tax=Cupriavidus sp. H18C1 TaxID=3241601 RepID=UPI003BB8C107
MAEASLTLAADNGAAAPPLGDGPTRQTIPLTGMRGAIARGMTAGWQIPRVAHSLEADVSAVEAKRATLQAELGDSVKVTLTAYVLRAAALTLRAHPRLNARVTDKEIELMPDVNIGLAVSLDDGLVVPVLREVDRKPVEEIAREARTLAEGARNGTLSAGAYQRGTFTISNLGMTEVERFTPILHAPQAAILGVTRVIRRAVVKDDWISIAPMMGLHLVFDHRAVDGYPAAAFLGDLKRRLESAEDL